MADTPKFDIVIATYRRPKKAGLLCQNLLNAFGSSIQHIIVVDSSDKLDKEFYPIADYHLKLLHSSHKNQPYQRYLGWTAATAEYILFLDDDMEILDSYSVLEAIDKMDQNGWVGIHFSFTNVNQALANMPKLKKYPNNCVFKILRMLSGKIIPKSNCCGPCGERGVYVPNKPIEFISGGSFAVRRQSLYINFNYMLMNISEMKLSKGEDFILGYTLSRQGVIWAWPGHPFLHNDENSGSHYAQDIQSFYRKVAFSRFYLNCEYLRLNNHNYDLKNKFLFHYFMLCRSIRVIFDCLIHPCQERWLRLFGWLSGWHLVVKTNWKKQTLDKQYWVQEAKYESNI